MGKIILIFLLLVGVCVLTLRPVVGRIFTDKDREVIREVIKDYFMSKLRDIYAISTRSRLGKRKRQVEDDYIKKPNSRRKFLKKNIF